MTASRKPPHDGSRPHPRDMSRALISAIENIGGNHHERIVEGVRTQEEIGREPDIPSIAEMLDVPLDRLTTEIARELHRLTGEKIIPLGRRQ